jgi:hypothetical protein
MDKMGVTRGGCREIFKSTALISNLCNLRNLWIDPGLSLTHK